MSMRDLNPHEMRSIRIPGASKSMNSNKNGLSFDNQDTSYKLKTTAGFDTMASDADTLKLEDIEKIKFDLNEEKNKIKAQENRLNKLIKKFKLKEEEIEDEKKYIQERKDDLTIKERSLLEEKKKFNELMEKFKEDKRNYDHQKEGIMSDIDEVRQNIIIAKSKNSIHEKKIAEYMNKIKELNNRRDYILSVYSAASNNSPDNTEYHSIQKRSTSAFYDDTFQMKPGHDRNKSSIYPEHHGTASVQSSDHKKIVNKENLVLQVKVEKNKINLMEKDLEALKLLEEQLVRELIEKEKKKLAASRSQSPFSLESSMNSALYAPNSDSMNRYLKPGGTLTDNLALNFESNDPNAVNINYASQARVHLHGNEEKLPSGTTPQKYPNSNLSLSSSVSSNPEGGSRDSVRARIKKKRNNCVNMAEIITKIDEKNA
jgi:hypothetical protein